METELDSADVFALDPNGFDVHFQIHDSFESLVAKVRGLGMALNNEGFKPKPQRTFGGGGGKPPAKAPEPIKMPDGETLTCGLCNSTEIYDNRERRAKENWRGPAFKCKKCNAVDWTATFEWKAAS